MRRGELRVRDCRAPRSLLAGRRDEYDVDRPIGCDGGCDRLPDTDHMTTIILRSLTCYNDTYVTAPLTCYRAMACRIAFEEGHNDRGHNYIGHDYIGHDYIG